MINFVDVDQVKKITRKQKHSSSAFLKNMTDMPKLMKFVKKTILLLKMLVNQFCKINNKLSGTWEQQVVFLYPLKNINVWSDGGIIKQ